MPGALGVGGVEGVAGFPQPAVMLEKPSGLATKGAQRTRIMPFQDSRFGFSRIEAMQLWGGVLVLTVAFALAYIGGVANVVLYFYVGGAPLLLVILVGSFIAVLSAFYTHEVAHKAVAQRYGAVAEFRHSPVGLLFGLITASFGMMIALPGAVVITGKVASREQMKISAAGPVVNLVFAAAFIGVSVALGTAPGRFREPIPIIIGNIAFVNVMLAMFNLLPVPAIAIKRLVAKRPVAIALPASDGHLVYSGSKMVWGACVAVLLAIGIGGRVLGVF